LPNQIERRNRLVTRCGPVRGEKTLTDRISDSLSAREFLWRLHGGGSPLSVVTNKMDNPVTFNTNNPAE
jgi:hypothetical protein